MNMASTMTTTITMGFAGSGWPEEFLQTSLSGVVVAGIVIAVLVTGLGLVSVSARAAHTATITGTASHGICLLTVFMGLYGVVPRFKAIFDGFDTELPMLTEVAAAASDAVVSHSYLAVLALLLLIGVEALALHSLNQKDATRTVSRRLFVGVSVILVSGLVLVTAALALPMVKLLNDLS